MVAATMDAACVTAPTIVSWLPSSVGTCPGVIATRRSRTWNLSRAVERAAGPEERVDDARQRADEVVGLRDHRPGDATMTADEHHDRRERHQQRARMRFQR